MRQYCDCKTIIRPRVAVLVRKMSYCSSIIRRFAVFFGVSLRRGSFCDIDKVIPSSHGSWRKYTPVGTVFSVFVESLLAGVSVVPRPGASYGCG